MSLRVVLLTRTSRPSGAQMAWRLFQAGFKPVAVIAEKRSRLINPPPQPSPRSAGEEKEGGVTGILFRFGIGFIWKRVWEVFRIRTRFYLRKFFPRRFNDPAYLSIEEWVLDHPSVRVYEVEDHNSAEVRELLSRLEPDIGILTNTRRIKKEILEIPRQGFFNLHLSALPQYAGLDSIFWALFHGEKEIGVTIHAASEEIDRGDILIQKKIPVCGWDDEESLYEKALWLGTHLMVEALSVLEAGMLERKPQRGEKSYFSWPTRKERAIFRRGVLARRQPLHDALKLGPQIRVLHVITRMTRGGAQENTLATVRGLQKKGYEAALLTGPSWGKEGEILSNALAEGLRVAILPELIRNIHPWKDFVAFLKLTSWLAKNRYAIIHTHTSKAGFLGRLGARFSKIPVVIHTPHGHVFHSYFSPWKEKLFLALERDAAKHTDRLIALTQRCREEHLKLGVGNSAQWLTISSGVDQKEFRDRTNPRETILASFGIAPDRKLVGFVGRLAPVKGARFLIEALPEIVKEIPSAHCLMVGDGEERTTLEARVQELDLEERVTFAGHRSPAADLISVFDVLVVPSLNEGMGRVIVEAGLLTKAVIGTNVGGIPDLIQGGETGILVERRNPGEIAKSVVRLLRDPGHSKQLGERLRAKVLAGFTEEIMVEKIDRLYQEVLRGKGVPFQPLEEVSHGHTDSWETALSRNRSSSG